MRKEKMGSGETGPTISERD